MLFCHELIHNRNTLIKLHNRNTLINIKGERTWNNTVSYTEDCILLYHEIKPTCNFFSPRKKRTQFIHFKLSSENIALFWSHKQLRHYICSLEISLWGCESYFFAISDKHRLCSSLIMPTPFIHPAHVWPSHTSGLVPVK